SRVLLLVNDPPTSDSYTLSLHDALPISQRQPVTGAEELPTEAAGDGLAPVHDGWHGEGYGHQASHIAGCSSIDFSMAFHLKYSILAVCGSCLCMRCRRAISSNAFLHPGMVCWAARSPAVRGFVLMPWPLSARGSAAVFCVPGIGLWPLCIRCRWVRCGFGGGGIRRSFRRRILFWR